MRLRRDETLEGEQGDTGNPFGSADKLVGIAPPCMSAAKNGLLGELYPEILNAETGYIEDVNVNMEELAKLEREIEKREETVAALACLRVRTA